MLLRTTSLTNSSINRALQVEGNSGSSSGASFVRNSNDALGPTIGLLKTRGTSNDSVTTVNNGDPIGVISFHATDGTSIVNNLTQIASLVDGPVSTGVIPTRLTFSTANTAGVANNTRMVIDSAGNVNIGSANNGGGTNTGGLSIAGKDIEIMQIMGAY
jgi:hypothetical protein